MTHDHLAPAARVLLDLNDAERIEHILGSGWIQYTRARDALRALERLLAHPHIHRMPNMALVGETNNGKTVIAQRFLRSHPVLENRHGSNIEVPVLYVQSPPSADEMRLLTTILETLYAPLTPARRVDERQFQVVRLMSSVNVRMLMIDEFQHAFTGAYNNRRKYLAAIKLLGNQLQIPIVAIGTEEVFHALRADRQLANRFEPFELPLWKDDQEYFRLLASFERILPLKKPSHLTDMNFAMRVLAMSEGTIGEVATILKRCAVWAIESGQECIDFKALQRIHYDTPSERKHKWGRTA